MVSSSSSTSNETPPISRSLLLLLACVPFDPPADADAAPTVSSISSSATTGTISKPLPKQLFPTSLSFVGHGVLKDDGKKTS
jgi:hypothetical protein